MDKIFQTMGGNPRNFNKLDLYKLPSPCFVIDKRALIDNLLTLNHLKTQTGVKILGLIDNMSYFKGDDGKEYKIFGESGVEKTAKEFNKEFLGHLPIHQDLRSSADKGDPLTHSDPNHEVSKLFKNIAEKIKQSFL